MPASPEGAPGRVRSFVRSRVDEFAVSRRRSRLARSLARAFGPRLTTRRRSRVPAPPEGVPGVPAPPEGVPGVLPAPPEGVPGVLPAPPEGVPGVPAPPVGVPGFRSFVRSRAARSLARALAVCTCDGARRVESATGRRSRSASGRRPLRPPRAPRNRCKARRSAGHSRGPTESPRARTPRTPNASESRFPQPSLLGPRNWLRSTDSPRSALRRSPPLAPPDGRGTAEVSIATRASSPSRNPPAGLPRSERMSRSQTGRPAPLSSLERKSCLRVCLRFPPCASIDMHTCVTLRLTVESPLDILASTIGRRPPSGYSCRCWRCLYSGPSNSTCPNPRH